MTTQEITKHILMLARHLTAGDVALHVTETAAGWRAWVDHQGFKLSSPSDPDLDKALAALLADLVETVHTQIERGAELLADL